MQEPDWHRLARRELGVAEAPGAKNNDIILQYGRDAGIDWYVKDSIAWCAVFVNAMLARAGYPSTKSALARRFLDYGHPLKRLRLGAIVVFPRAGSPLYGHVGFVQSWDRHFVYVLGGNQSDAVTVARFRRDSILPNGIRWPDQGDVSVAPPPPKAMDKEDVVLIRGDAGDAVMALQASLNLVGATLDPDGDFGPLTEAAVKDFQRREGLTVDGEAGPATMAALTAALAARQAPKATAGDQAAVAASAPGALAGGAIAEPPLDKLVARAEGVEAHLTSGDWLRIGLAVLLLSPALYALGRWAWRRWWRRQP